MTLTEFELAVGELIEKTILSGVDSRDIAILLDIMGKQAAEGEFDSGWGTKELSQ